MEEVENWVKEMKNKIQKTYLYKLSKNDIRKNKKKGLMTHNKWGRKVEFHKAPSSNMGDKEYEPLFFKVFL